MSLSPVVVPANQPRSFYLGAGRARAFRAGERDLDAPRENDYYPEDWVGSTTARFRQEPAGLTVLPGGSSLRDVVAADPAAWLGEDHVRRHGDSTGILVKLLDAGQRLPLHVHPTREFAGAHLASPYGKTEAWVVIAARADAYAHLGFSSDVEAADLAGWVATQDVPAMLAVTNRVPVAAGDVVVCPSGLPHALGDGIFVVEVQEPTDFSVLLEWEGFDLDGPAEGHLQLGWELALECVDRGAWRPERLKRLRERLPGAAVTAGTSPGVQALMNAAEGLFAAQLLTSATAHGGAQVVVEPSFSVLVVLDGEGALVSEDGTRTVVRRGMTLVTPFAAGALRVEGDLTVVRCLPD